LSRLGAVLAREWPLLLLISAGVYLHWALLTGPMPVNGDHQVHLFKGWLMADHMIPSGRLIGWSHMAYAGYPVSMYYPFVGYAYLALVRYLSFGLVSWETTYSVALFLVVMMKPAAVYVITRRAAGPMGSMLAGLISIADIGGWRQGGSVHTMLYGVWPFALAVVLSVIVIPLLDSTLARGAKGGGKVIALAILLALAVMCHPMAAFFFPAVVLPWLVASMLTRGRDRARILGRAAVAVALAIGLALFWLVPGLATGAEQTESYGAGWHSLGKLFTLHADNRLFDKFCRIAWVLSLLGFVLALISRRLYPTCLAVTTALLFLTTGAIASSFGHTLQPERMAAFIKMLMFALAGYAVHRVGSLTRWSFEAILRRMGRGSAPRAIAAVGIVLALGLAAAYVAYYWDSRLKTVVKQRKLTSFSWVQFREANEWIARQPSTQLDRVLYVPHITCSELNPRRRKCRHAYSCHYWDSGPVWSGKPRVRFGFEPTAVFDNLPLNNWWHKDWRLIKKMFRDRRSLRNLNVRWVVTADRWPTGRGVEIARPGVEIHVYRIDHGTDSPAKLSKRGHLQTLEFEDEHIEVYVADADPSSRILFPVAHHPWWKLTQNGEEAAISRHRVITDGRKILMAAPAVGGTTELRFVRPWYARISGLVSLFCWIGCLYWFVCRIRLRE
jgi:hypothetical protein